MRDFSESDFAMKPSLHVQEQPPERRLETSVCSATQGRTVTAMPVIPWHPSSCTDTMH